MAHIPDLEGDEVAAASLLSMPRLKGASSRTRPSICSLTRGAQKSLSLNGAFCPTIFPLFHGLRRAALSVVVPMMDLLASGDVARPPRRRHRL
jgi:hypothetical protein